MSECRKSNCTIRPSISVINKYVPRAVWSLQRLCRFVLKNVFYDEIELLNPLLPKSMLTNISNEHPDDAEERLRLYRQ
jgi:hypothetical protein